MEKEIEVKFKIENIDNIRGRLLEWGAVLKEPYKQTTYGFFQTNQSKEAYFLE